MAEQPSPRPSLANPDVVLMDLRMPGGDGVTATAEITRAKPSTRVLVLTTYDTDSDILRAVEAGATGYLLKDVTAERLVDAVRAAARGETVLAAPVAARLMRRLRSPEADGPHAAGARRAQGSGPRTVQHRDRP